MRVNTLWELFCPYHKFLVYNLVRRNLIIKYRKSVLGFLWSLIVPASTALVYYLIFKYVMKVSVEHYVAFILMGILPWSFFLNCIGGGIESLTGNHNLLNKIPLPLHALPLSECISALINFIFSIPILLIVVFVVQAPVTWNYLFLPWFIFLLFLQCYSYSLILGIGYVYFRDLKHATAILTQLLFYITPILYKMDMVPEDLKFLIYFNPLSMLFASMNEIVSTGNSPTQFQWIHSFFYTAGIFLFAYWFIRKQQNKVVEYL